MNTFPDADIGQPSTADTGIGQYRQWFRDSVDRWQDWRDAATEDFAFVAGAQWTDIDRRAMEKGGYPPIVINKIKPLINVLSGYQRLNRYDIDFLPRTDDDMALCRVRKGMTKYIFDQCDYEYKESRAFMDGVICGIGCLEVKYKFDEEIMDGEAQVVRVSPFDIYPDAEAHESDFSDASYIIRAKWADKDDLKLVYPEHADEIDLQIDLYDADEGFKNADTDTWYRRDSKKLRLVECWYKTKERAKVILLPDGRVLKEKEFTEQIMAELLQSGAAIEDVEEREIIVTKVKLAVFFDQIILEEMDSPYEHGDFPFAFFTVFNFGEEDLTAGVVRDLKDPQREINKRRTQMMHILSSQSNSGWITESGALTPAEKSKLEKTGSKPGVVVEVTPGAMGKLQKIEPSNPPLNLLQAEQEAAADLPAISGINEALMGTDIPASTSGRAIELKQKQAITQIAPLFDNLRQAKKHIATLLWGTRGRKGLVQQFYTDDKIYRIEGPNGAPQFIRVNQQVQQSNPEDPLKGTITSVLNDLSQGDFDVIIADTQASTTQRQAQMWSLVDAVSKLGIPGDLVFDLIISLSDIPNKDDLIQRWKQRQEQQAQQQQQAQQLELQKEMRMSNSIAFKDAPFPIQLAMAAKSGLIGADIAQYAINQAVQAWFPAYAQQQQQAAQAQRQQQQEQVMLQSVTASLQKHIPPAEILKYLVGKGIPQQQAIALITKASQLLQQGQQGQQQQQEQSPQESMPTQPVQQQGQQQSAPVTKAAMQSIMSGQTPAM